MKISDDREFESPFGFAFVNSSKCYNIRLSCEYAILSDILPYWCRLILSCSLYTPSHMQNWIILAYQPLCTCMFVRTMGLTLASSCFLCNYYYANYSKGTFVLLRMCVAAMLLLSYERCLTSFVCCIMLRLWCYADAEICILIQD